MATGFVESATLQLNNKGVDAKLKGTNKALRDLNTSAKALSSTLKSIPSVAGKLSTPKGVAAWKRAAADMKKAGEDLRKVTGRSYALRVSVSGTPKAKKDLTSLQKLLTSVRASSKTAITIRVRVEGGKAVEDLLNLLGRNTSRPVILRIDTRPARKEATGFLNFIRESWGRALRVPGYALGGEMTQAFRATIGRGTSAPLNLDDARARVRASGMDDTMSRQMETWAGELSAKYLGVTTADILTASIEAAGSSNNLDTIRANMELIAKNAVIYAAATGDAAQGAEMARKSFKAAQIQGVDADPIEAARYMEAQAKAYIASGLDVQPGEMVAALRSVGALRFGMSDQALMELMLARDEGGRMNTAEYRMAFQELIRGSLSKEKTALQIRSGLRNEDGSARTEVVQKFAQSPLEFTEEIIIPLLLRAGVDIDDLASVQAAIENEIGYNTSAARVLTGIVLQREQTRTELEKAQRANPDYFIDNPTTRQKMTAVGAQFENLMAQMLEGALPVMNFGLDTMTGAFASAAQSGWGAKELATVGAAAIPVGLTAAMMAMSNENTRPLGAAGLALTGSAAALDASAVALTAAAAAQGASGVAGGPAEANSKKRGGFFKNFLSWGWVLGKRAAPIAAIPIVGGGADTTDLPAFEEMKRKSEARELPGQVLVDRLLGILPGSDTHLKRMREHIQENNPWANGSFAPVSSLTPSNSNEILEFLSRADTSGLAEALPDLRVEAEGAAETMAGTLDEAAPFWGSAMAEAVSAGIATAGDTLAAKIRDAIQFTPVTTTGGPAVLRGDAGTMDEG